MKRTALLLTPLLLSGFMLPDNKCGHNTQVSMNAIQTDGPYVMYSGNNIVVKYILDDNGWKVLRAERMPVTQKTSLILTVATDERGKTFPVQLKDEIKNEKAEYRKVSKQLVISDIEGNFQPFRKLLQSNGVIDSSFNWTFGEGHLVLTGDFVDRGNQVTEVLWLIYSLEEKAKAAGGYVHFILGNHEIMNMSADLRYLNEKYKDNAIFLNERYERLYGENSELGRWLRSKNIVEKIGDVLYIHGGISAYVNNMNASLSKINDLARPFYPDTTFNYPDRRTEILFSDYGPFWYRGYYTGKVLATQQQVDSTLEKFNVSRIATGHTIVADTISVRFDGKVFNTDVHHAKGLSGGLYIEGGQYYRVNMSGEKFPLLIK